LTQATKICHGHSGEKLLCRDSQKDALNEFVATQKVKHAPDLLLLTDNKGKHELYTIAFCLSDLSQVLAQVFGSRRIAFAVTEHFLAFRSCRVCHNQGKLFRKYGTKNGSATQPHFWNLWGPFLWPFRNKIQWNWEAKIGSPKNTN